MACNGDTFTFIILSIILWNENGLIFQKISKASILETLDRHSLNKKTLKVIRVSKKIIFFIRHWKWGEKDHNKGINITIVYYVRKDKQIMVFIFCYKKHISYPRTNEKQVNQFPLRKYSEYAL